MKQINVCLPLHEHMQTHLTTAICCHTPGVSATIYTPQPTLIRASIAAAPASETGIHLDVVQSLIVTFSLAFMQKIMNNEAQIALDATAAF